MNTTAREIIVNAFDEARIVSRKQPINGTMFETALGLLKRRLSKYSATDLLSFLRREKDFTPTKAITKIGEYQLKEDLDFPVILVDTVADLPSVSSVESDTSADTIAGIKTTNECYEISNSTWAKKSAWTLDNICSYVPDVEIMNMGKISRVFLEESDIGALPEVDFVSYLNFYQLGDTSLIYSVNPTGNDCLDFFVKPMGVNKTFKLIYTERFEVEADTAFNIPELFVTLFTTALVYDLSCKYARVNDNSIAMLKQNLIDAEELVRENSANVRFIGRDLCRNYHNTMADFIAGRFI